MFFEEEGAFAGVDLDEIGVGDALAVVLDGAVLAFVGAEGVAAGFVGDDFGEGLVGQLDDLFIGDDVDGAEGAVEVGGRADLLDGRDGLFVVAPEIEGRFVGIDGGGMAGRWWWSCSEEEASAVFGEGEGGVVVDDEAGMEAGCGGGGDERGFGFGGLPEIEVVERLLVCGRRGRVADEGEFVGVVVPGQVLVTGLAGDEFVRGCRISAGGGEDEDAVGFGFGRDDGVGEGLAVLA